METFVDEPVRVATLGDWRALERLERECLPDPWSDYSLKRALETPGYLCLICGDSGYLIGWQVGDEAEIARLGVSFLGRGQGRGLLLVCVAMETWRARGVKSVWLEVRASNQNAQRLYERAGFEIVGRRPRYYGDGEDAILMRRESVDTGDSS